ncbi:hypothetical protein QE152_g25342 [Popillia japonica]|uniref:Ectopic P granules protein 5 homolog n=2 Tax=Popillia japonica TaxID=7064 RepID=A0AAW1K124_POPJA
MEQCMERPKQKQKKKKREKAVVNNEIESCTTERENSITEEISSVPEENQPDNHIDQSVQEVSETVQQNEITQDEISKEVPQNIETPTDQIISANTTSKALNNPLKNGVQDGQPESLTFDKVLMKNRQIIQTVEQINQFYDEYSMKQGSRIEPPLIKCTNEVKFKPENIRPYTEAQLLSLYSNSEIETLQQFLFAFVDYELKGAHIRQHPLYTLLEQYLQSKNKIAANDLDIEQARKEYFEIQNQLWLVNSSVIKEQGECQDGNIVHATHTYNKATFHRGSFQAMNAVLTKIRQLSNECHVLYSYSASINKLQIELFIQNLCISCINMTGISKSSPVTLNLQDNTPEMLMQLQELKTCISILFQFQRRLIRDADFRKETRSWLQDLVAILLRVANYQDHLFLLSHVLRCPPGISVWASTFVQTPLPASENDSPFSSFEINHIMTILALLLLPIDKREQFLEELMQHKDNPGEALWVMVDSDGEEDEESSGLSLRENDLVSLFNQLPIDDVFRMLLKVRRRDGQDYLDGSQITEHHLLRLLAFSTMILRILQNGLQTYAQNRYNQFAKRLCRMVRHIVQYATDLWDFFKNNQNLNDSAMLERLQVEYDAFFLRAIYCLYSSKKMGAWQFLAVVPYNLISRKCLWKIFYFLHDPDSSVKSILDPTDNTDYSEKLWNMNMRNQFEEKLNSLEDSESYYLLNTFANMALLRNSEDIDFIEAATCDLLHIGFISEATQENCCKNARILLTHITSKYPSLFSYILRIVETNIDKIGSLSLYLYEELPISIWKPDDSDIMMITNLLKSNDINHPGSKLARMIISRLNWDLVGESLFIPYTYHCKIALLVAEIVLEESRYSQWAWQTLFRLRLHYTDKGLTDFGKIFEPERFDVLRRGMKEQNLICCFLSLLMTTWGHLIPVICSKGFDQLLLLQVNQRHEAVLFILNLIIPLFLNCQETLINCEKFQNIITGALNAEKGYLHLAKTLIGVQNIVIQQFGHLIENHILNYRHYGAESAKYVVRIWINSLVSTPNWNKDFGVMYLLDIIVKSSFLDDDALSCCIANIKDLLQIVSPQDQSSTISSLFKWVTPSQGSLLINSSLGGYPWLAYLIIDLEFEERERQTGLWREILSQLENQKGRINVDAAIKKAANFLKVPSFTSGSLCIFRWAQQALDSSIDHPLLPLMWQKFFSLYLYRLPVSGCIGEKFFEGVINFQFQKRLKRHLAECVSFYQKQYDEAKMEENSNRKLLFEANLGIFKAYSLWLEEPTLQESTLYLPSLPPEYKPDYLSLIFQGNTSPWMEFVNTYLIHDNQQQALKSWRSANYREKTNVNQPLPQPGNRNEPEDPEKTNVNQPLPQPGNRNEPEDPCERIIMRLKTYDMPKGPPSINMSTPVIPSLKTYDMPKGPPSINMSTPVIPSFSLTDKNEMFKSLDDIFKTISKFAREHNLSCSEYKTLDCMYQELVPQLYISVINKVKKQVTCSGPNKSSHCSGPAVITLQAKEARMNEGIRYQIDTNRRNYDTLLKKFLLPPAQHVCVSAVTLLQAISDLRAKLVNDQSTLEMGVELFYYILNLLTEEINNYLPGKQLYSQCLQVLGQSHLHGREFEHPRLLNNILEKPELKVYLLPHFVPVNSGTANFILMYSTICEKILEKYDVALALLSKFDVHFWLKTKNPKLAQRSKFINILVQALQTLGFEPHADSASLHTLLRKHLICMLDHQFPEHFGEILMVLLKASNCGMDCGYIAVSVWLDFLNYLSKPIELNMSLPLRDQIRLYAQKQRLLRHNELLETASLLSKHFMQERFQYGLYGLYPKTRNYVEVFMAFNGMIGHALVISTLNMHPGVLGDSLCEIIWPYVRDMFSPCFEHASWSFGRFPL